MKEVMNIGIGGKCFVIENSAYDILKDYLKEFSQRTKLSESKEVMEDIEERIAELLSEEINTYKNVVTEPMVINIVSRLGMPNGEEYSPKSGRGAESLGEQGKYHRAHNPRKLYRDTDEKALGGVCSGLAYFLNIDLVLVRILFILGLIMGTLTFWLYIILWIVVPKAVSPVQKCSLRGWPATAENLRKFQ